VGFFTGRWSIEVTFQEVRQHLGFTTPRNLVPQERPAHGPCLLGLFSLVALIFHRLWQRNHVAPRRDPWYAKKEVTFSDTLAAVRRVCWSEVLIKPWNHAGVTKLPRPLRLTLLDQLCGRVRT